MDEGDGGIIPPFKWGNNERKKHKPGSSKRADCQAGKEEETAAAEDSRRAVY